MILIKNLIDEMKTNIDEQVEICANIEDNKMKHIQMGVLETDKNGKVRNMCKHLKYSHVIYHSHPKKAYSYPSAEDIIKVMKNGQIKISLISTKWGLWIIKNTPTSNGYSAECSEKWKNIIQQFINDIGINTSKHPSTRLENEDKSMDFVDDFNNIIYKNIKIIQKITNLSIQFYDWKNLIDDIKV